MIANLEEIKARADILSVVEAYLPLHKTGYLYKGNCPFHSERTPSFMVNTKKNLFYCFGCNEGGDAFKFIEKLNHCNFTQAVEEVAKICNISVSYDENKKAFGKNVFFEALEKINTFLKQSLQKDSTALAELKERGLSDGEIVKFEFGLFNINALVLFLKQNDLLKIALNLGVVSEGKGGLYSIFDKRITLPIRNETHKVVAFSGRIRNGENNPAKYVNSKESLIYKKSFILFNLSNAKTSILKQNEVILCEGYYDIFALRKFGFENCVASCGTSFTLSHLSLLHKMANNLKYVLSFDKDNAGENANLKTLELFFNEGIFNINVRVINKKVKDYGDLLKLGFKDINDCYKDYGGFEYYIKLNLKRIGEDKTKKHDFFKRVKDLIHRQANFFLKDNLIGEASGYFGCEKAYFMQNAKIETRTNTSLLKVLVKNILINEKAEILAKNYFDARDFKDYAEGLRVYFDKRILARELLSLSCDESVKILNDDELKECFKAYKKELLNAELKKAKNSNNFNLIVEIVERLREIESKA